jgi:putative glutamine amidotransferase
VPASRPHRPRIGIACAILPAAWGPWQQPAAVVAADYVRHVQRAGGMAFVLPPHDGDADEVLAALDGLMLTGGNDIEAAVFGASPHAEAEVPDPARDDWESRLVRAAIDRGMPLLGICRGMQVLNVALGGTLTQHLPESHGHEGHRRTTGTFDGNDHMVDITPGSLAARAAGETVHRVPSHHHQAVERLGDGLVLSGVASDDGVAEAIELPGAPFVLGVQWHPEADPGSGVIAAFVTAAHGR